MFRAGFRVVGAHLIDKLTAKCTYFEGPLRY